MNDCICPGFKEDKQYFVPNPDCSEHGSLTKWYQEWFIPCEHKRKREEYQNRAKEERENALLAALYNIIQHESLGGCKTCKDLPNDPGVIKFSAAEAMGLIIDHVANGKAFCPDCQRTVISWGSG